MGFYKNKAGISAKSGKQRYKLACKRPHAYEFSRGKRKRQVIVSIRGHLKSAVWYTCIDDDICTETEESTDKSFSFVLFSTGMILAF